MKLFTKYHEPIVLKETSCTREQLLALEEMLPAISDPEARLALQRDMAAAEAGISCGDTVMAELLSCHMPLFVLRGLCLEHKGVIAQIDFLIITSHRNFIIECENLFGNIELSASGGFSRTFKDVTEEIGSPVVLGRDNLELIKNILGTDRNNFMARAMLDRYFYQDFQPIAVLADPKTTLNDSSAPAQIKNQIIRADRLIEYIRSQNSSSDSSGGSESEARQLAAFFLSRHTPCKTGYPEKYRQYITPILPEPRLAAPGPQFPTPALEESILASSQPESHPVPIALQPPRISPPPEGAPKHAKNSKNTALPKCPCCGAPMVRRRTPKGGDAGSEFWVCSKHPHCRGIVRIK